MTRRPPPDTDFSQTQHLDGWNKQGVQFVFGSGFILNSSSFTLEAWRADGTLQWSVPYSDTTAGNKTVTVSDAGNLHITGSWFGYQYYLIGTANRPGTMPSMAMGADGTLYVPAGDSFGGQHSLQAFAEPPNPASFTPFGNGCPGNAGVPTLRASPNSLPWTGQTFIATLTNVEASNYYSSLGIMGTSRTMLGNVPLPLDLTVVGMAGCSLYTDLVSIMPLLTMTGRADWHIAVPNVPSIVGALVYTQCLTLSRGTNAAGYVMSNACELRVGECR